VREANSADRPSRNAGSGSTTIPAAMAHVTPPIFPWANANINRSACRSSRSRGLEQMSMRRAVEGIDRSPTCTRTSVRASSFISSSSTRTFKRPCAGSRKPATRTGKLARGSCGTRGSGSKYYWLLGCKVLNPARQRRQYLSISMADFRLAASPCASTSDIFVPTALIRSLLSDRGLRLLFFLLLSPLGGGR